MLNEMLKLLSPTLSIDFIVIKYFCFYQCYSCVPCPYLSLEWSTESVQGKTYYIIILYQAVHNKFKTQQKFPKDEFLKTRRNFDYSWNQASWNTAVKL